MSAAKRSWEPANEVERRMREAWSAGDASGFANLLVHAPLYLPSFPTEPDGTQRLLTRQRDGGTYILVFTSVRAMGEAVGHVAAGWRLTSFAELVEGRPDPDWGLVVSPQTPIGAYLEPGQLTQLSLLAEEEQPFHPADENERLMRLAQQSGEPATYLDVLLVSTVLLPVTAPAAATDLEHDGFPYLITYRDGLPTINVFTSAARLHESMPESMPESLSESLPESLSGGPHTVAVGFATVVRTWPDVRFRLAVNPDSAIEAVFTGAQLPDLWQWAQDLLTRQSAPQSSAGTDPPQPAPVWSVEVPVGQSDVDRFLVGGQHRVTGTARVAGTVATQFGHLVRWYQDPAGLPDDLAVVEWALPHGAQLIRLTAGEELVLASYDAELLRWNPAIGTVLRGYHS